MDAVKITLNKKNFVLRFGMKFFKVLGQRLGTDTLISTQNEVLKFLQTFNDKQKDISFDQVDIINYLIVSAILANEENTETITISELDQIFLTDTVGILEATKAVVNGFIASMPKLDKAQDQGKPKAPAKKNQTKPSQKK